MAERDADAVLRELTETLRRLEDHAARQTRYARLSMQALFVIWLLLLPTAVTAVLLLLDGSY